MTDLHRPTGSHRPSAARADGIAPLLVPGGTAVDRQLLAMPDGLRWVEEIDPPPDPADLPPQGATAGRRSDGYAG